ncbi:DNA ligase D [Bacillus kwashiorkori]|uniref:DNA ligase D n=1 Tax=Bacillus kwashiorkori TaxID=1522318 RepID=UPI000784E7E0|nr:DNA ligase D [Bacillus kwashiorkori]
MRPMLPTLTFTVPTEKDWVFETKYDGFRALLTIDKGISFISRNGKDLSKHFPEVIQFYELYKEKLISYEPLTLDGEITVLVNPYKSNFSQVQQRGRLRSEQKIQHILELNRGTYLVFDLLQYKGTSLINQPFYNRKEMLLSFFQELQLPTQPIPEASSFLQMVPFHKDFQKLWANIEAYDGEGIVAKNIYSKWEVGKRSVQWFKYKNWKKVQCFITKFEKANGYFHVGVYSSGKIVTVGLFKNGLTKEETAALTAIIRKNQVREDNQFVYVPPSICLELFYLELMEDGLREPFFSRFLLNISSKECTLERMKQTSSTLIEITHPDKPLWEERAILKQDYVNYLNMIYPYIAPFLNKRPLTVIRYPHGIFGEAFFQKNCPEYAPDYVDTFQEDGINYIVCNNKQTFLWLGNQLAIEFHIPFRTSQQNNPNEIVIDLDPPTKKEFSLALEAAHYIKTDIIDKLGLRAYIKTSGNRGLQIYFPLPRNNSITWNETRLFTQFIANFLLSKNEHAFTIERLKKNRNNKLYIDYVQHAEGKTIICPYSARGNKSAGVATPIFWDELSNNISPDGFSFSEVLNRMEKLGDPFADYFTAKDDGAIKEIILFLKNAR